MSQPTPIPPIWVALATFFALVVAVGAGVLGWLSGQHPAAAVLIGGAAFGGSLALTLSILKALRG